MMSFKPALFSIICRHLVFRTAEKRYEHEEQK